MRIPKTWVVTDTHFNHKTLVEEGWRPADYQRRIMREWAHVVHGDDLVYHLGDVIFGNQSELSSIMASLPGTKVLVRGNHDKQSDGWFTSRGFAYVASGILTKGVWLSHHPAQKLPDGALVNVHGHLHNSTHRGDPKDFPAHCRLLALEYTDYKPVELEKFAGLSAYAKIVS